jgi:hypothetical protein
MGVHIGVCKVGMKCSLLLIAVSSLILMACATPAERMEAQRISEIQAQVSNGDYKGAFDGIFPYLGDGNDLGENARKVIVSSKEFQARTKNLIQDRVDKADNERKLSSVLRVVKYDGPDAPLSVEDRRILLSEIDAKAADTNRSGQISWLLNDDLALYPSLAVPDARRIIFDRSVQYLRPVDGKREPQAEKVVAKVFAVAAEAGPSSYEYRLLQQELPKLVLSSADLQNHVAKLFPQYAEKELQERRVTVRLVTEPEDRLLELDLGQKLGNLSPNIGLVSGNDADVTVTVERLQWDERDVPNRTQTVTYNRGDVNLLAAALLMPRGASYLYEVNSGGIQLSYAYEVRADGKGMEPISELIREKESRSWNSCSNARIQNVFGGVERADFLANQHMQSACSGGSRPVSIDDLREGALTKIAHVIAKVPSVAKAVDER